jgi:hypothetical protein
MTRAAWAAMRAGGGCAGATANGQDDCLATCDRGLNGSTRPAFDEGVRGVMVSPGSCCGGDPFYKKDCIKKQYLLWK